MSINYSAARRFFIIATLGIALALNACATVPKEALELSNTVGRDLEEVHRSHRALASLLFDLMEKDANRFIDEVYGPAYIQKFAEEFQLDVKVKGIVSEAPENLLPVLVRFVKISTENIESKRQELVGPIKEQRTQVIEGIDASHRQLQSAQAVLAGHLASVRKVHDAQNEIMAKAGLDGIREKLATKTAEVSERIAGLIEEAEKAEGKMDKIEEVLVKIKDTIKTIKQSEEQ